MAFRDYRKYTASKLQEIFQIEIKIRQNLFDGFTPSGREYPDLQAAVKSMYTRLRLSKFDNEATRGSLLVARILWEAGERYHLGVFF